MLTARITAHSAERHPSFGSFPPSASNLLTLKRGVSSQDVQVMRGRGTSLTLCVTSCFTVTLSLYLSWWLCLHLIPMCHTEESPPHSASWQVTDSRPATTKLCLSVSIQADSSFFSLTRPQILKTQSASVVEWYGACRKASTTLWFDSSWRPLLHIRLLSL